MSFPLRKPPPVIPLLAGIDEDTQASAQEALPVRYIAGETAVALEWISPIYNQYAEEAPNEGGAKK
jgi:hypothetical protein